MSKEIEGLMTKHMQKIVRFLKTDEHIKNVDGNTLLDCGHYCTTYGLFKGNEIFCHDCKNEGEVK